MGIKYAVNETFFDDWTDVMAYVLGYLYADGSLENSPSIRGKYVRATSTDRDRIYALKKLLGSAHQIAIENRAGNRRPLYCLRIGSTRLYDRLVEIGMTPRKSHTMKFPSVPERYLALFIRGYFDGDGGMYIEFRPNGSLKKLRVVFTSGSRSFLTDLHLKLREYAQVGERGLYQHASTSGTFQLRYSSRDSLNIGIFMYSGKVTKDLLMQRKYDIFTRYLRLYTAVKKPRLRLDGLVAKK